MPKFTPWFSEQTKPMHVGKYPSSVAHNDDPRYATRLYWDGKCWLWPNTMIPVLTQQRYWCGLTEPATDATPESQEGDA